MYNTVNPIPPAGGRQHVVPAALDPSIPTGPRSNRPQTQPARVVPRPRPAAPIVVAPPPPIVVAVGPPTEEPTIPAIPTGPRGWRPRAPIAPPRVIPPAPVAPVPVLPEKTQQEKEQDDAQRLLDVEAAKVLDAEREREREAQRVVDQQKAAEREDLEAAKRRLVALQRWLPKGPVAKPSPLNPEIEAEVRSSLFYLS